MISHVLGVLIQNYLMAYDELAAQMVPTAKKSSYNCDACSYYITGDWTLVAWLGVTWHLLSPESSLVVYVSKQGMSNIYIHIYRLLYFV
jgi:hypothetical protein